MERLQLLGGAHASLECPQPHGGARAERLCLRSLLGGVWSLERQLSLGGAHASLECPQPHGGARAGRRCLR